MHDNAIQQSLLGEFAASLLRSEDVRKQALGNTHPFAASTAASELEVRLKSERSMRQRLAAELARIGHPVQTVRLSSPAPWATTEELPSSGDYMSWYLENGHMIVQTTSQFVDFAEEELANITQATVARETLVEYCVPGMETPQKARRWLMDSCMKLVRH